MSTAPVVWSVVVSVVVFSVVVPGSVDEVFGVVVVSGSSVVLPGGVVLVVGGVVLVVGSVVGSFVSADVVPELSASVSVVATLAGQAGSKPRPVRSARDLRVVRCIWTTVFG